MIWLYQVMQVPAIVAIGVWFVFQLFSGVGTRRGAGGGVAYGAHIGGFVAGVVLVQLFGAGPARVSGRLSRRDPSRGFSRTCCCLRRPNPSRS